MYIFVIDTEDYAGNFEREMCAYMTGCIGQCGVGEEYAEVFRRETGLEEVEGVIDTRQNDDDCFRPCLIMETPGWATLPNGTHFRLGNEQKTRCPPAYLSVGIWFEDKPDDETIDFLRKRAVAFLTSPKLHEFDSRPRKITGFRLLLRVYEQGLVGEWTCENIKENQTNDKDS